MNWIEFQNLIFDLDHVTHFEIIHIQGVCEVRAYLNIGYPKVEDKDEHQAHIKVAEGDTIQCQNWIKEIIAGKYNLPCKGHLYPIMEILNRISKSLEQIASKLTFESTIKK